jgi:hypothetical protein
MMPKAIRLKQLKKPANIGCIPKDREYQGQRKRKSFAYDQSRSERRKKDCGIKQNHRSVKNNQTED